MWLPRAAALVFRAMVRPRVKTGQFPTRTLGGAVTTYIKTNGVVHCSSEVAVGLSCAGAPWFFPHLQPKDSILGVATAERRMCIHVFGQDLEVQID